MALKSACLWIVTQKSKICLLHLGNSSQTNGPDRPKRKRPLCRRCSNAKKWKRDAIPKCTGEKVLQPSFWNSWQVKNFWICGISRHVLRFCYSDQVMWYQINFWVEGISRKVLQLKTKSCLHRGTRMILATFTGSFCFCSNDSETSFEVCSHKSKEGFDTWHPSSQGSGLMGQLVAKGNTRHLIIHVILNLHRW